MGKQWKFNLGDHVAIHVAGCRGEGGEVIGRAEYNYAEDSYLVRYVSGAGDTVERWWTASALESHAA